MEAFQHLPHSGATSQQPPCCGATTLYLLFLLIDLPPPPPPSCDLLYHVLQQEEFAIWEGSWEPVGSKSFFTETASSSLSDLSALGLKAYSDYVIGLKGYSEYVIGLKAHFELCDCRPTLRMLLD